MRQAHEQKQEIIKQIKDKFDKSKSSIVLEYRGLSVTDMTNLRIKLRKQGVELKVYKNTLTSRALEKTDLKDLEKDLKGPNAIAFAMEDAIAPAKILVDFAKTNKALVIKTGVFEGKIISVDEIREIASLPTKEDLISMFASCLIAPLRDFGLVVKEIAKKNESGAE